MISNFSLLIPLACLFGKWYLISKFSKSSQGESALFTVVLITLVLFLSGLAGILEQTNILLKLLGIVGLAFCIYEFIRLKRVGLETPSIYALVMTTGAFILAGTPYYSLYTNVDDFSHWGKMAQVLTDEDRFIVKSDELGVSDYPPALASFIYFFTNTAGFSVSKSLFSQAVLVIFVFSSLIPSLRERNARSGSAYFLMLILASYSLIWIFRHGFHTLWADLPLGILFGVTIFLYLKNYKSHTGFSRFAYLAPLALIPITKQIGIVIFLGIVLIIILESIRKVGNGFPSMKELGGQGLGIAFGLSLYLLWMGYVEVNHLNKTFSAPLSLSEVYDALTQTGAVERHDITKGRFFEWVFFSVDTIKYWFLLSLMGFILVYKIERPSDPRGFLQTVSYCFFGLFLWLLLLLTLYLFSFSEWEGVRLASIDRYTATYLLGLLVCLFGFLGHALLKPRISGKSRVTIISLLLLLALPNFGRFSSDFFKAISLTAYPNQSLSDLMVISEAVKLHTPETSSSYLLWSSGANDVSVVFKFLIHPRVANKDCSSIFPAGHSKGDEDPWSCVMDKNKWSERLLQYDHLIVTPLPHASGEYFFPDFPPLGSDKFVVYRVQKNGRDVSLVTVVEGELNEAR